jgi:hypothetical protein
VRGRISSTLDVAAEISERPILCKDPRTSNKAKERREKNSFKRAGARKPTGRYEPTIHLLGLEQVVSSTVFWLTEPYLPYCLFSATISNAVSCVAHNFKPSIAIQGKPVPGLPARIYVLRTSSASKDPEAKARLRHAARCRPPPPSKSAATCSAIVVPSGGCSSTTSSVASDFSRLRFAKTDYRGKLTCLALEGSMQACDLIAIARKLAVPIDYPQG